MGDAVTSHPYIRVTDMRPGRVDTSDVKYVPVAAYPPIKAYRIFKEDLFISVAGTLGLVGKIPEELDGANLTENANRISSIGCDRDFLLHVMLSPIVQGVIESERTVGAQPKLALTRIRKFLIPIPADTREQSAIATALSDVDALLAAQDALIAKKRAIKQGAMQELLTGKRRLPGFCGQWKVWRLKDVADCLKGFGLSKSSISEDGRQSCILYGELFTRYARVVRSVHNRTNAGEGLMSVHGDILMPGSTTTCGEDLATASALLMDGVSLGGDINVIRSRGNCYDPVFLAEYLSSACRYQIAQLTQGITIYHLYGRELRELELELPELDEQTAIAEILMEMDSEIETLELKRTKTAHLKHAMMQELLTGRIRLV